MGRNKTRLFPSFDLIFETFVEASNIPGQVVNAELLADTGKFRSAALGTEGGGLGVRGLCPFTVLLAHVFGCVLLEHDNVLIGDGLTGDFRHCWEFFSLHRKWVYGKKIFCLIWSLRGE